MPHFLTDGFEGLIPAQAVVLQLVHPFLGVAVAQAVGTR